MSAVAVTVRDFGACCHCRHPRSGCSPVSSRRNTAVPDSYPMTLNALRLMQQSTNRRPVVAYDDRTVEQALMSLKSVGPCVSCTVARRSHDRHRHVADERGISVRAAGAVGAGCAARRPPTRSPPASNGCCRPTSRRRSRPCSTLAAAPSRWRRLERHLAIVSRWVATLGEQTVDPDVAARRRRVLRRCQRGDPRPSLAGQPEAGPSTGGPSGAGSSAVGASGVDQATADLVRRSRY